MNPHFRVMMVGGDARVRCAMPRDIELRWVGSRRYAGNGALRRVLAAIRGGAVDAVVLRVRWLGHSASGAIRAACRRAGIQCRTVAGGEGAALRAALELAGRRH